MKAIRASRTGGPEVLELVDQPTPRPGSGEALVRVEAAGVNFVDTTSGKLLLVPEASL